MFGATATLLVTEHRQVTHLSPQTGRQMKTQCHQPGICSLLPRVRAASLPQGRGFTKPHPLVTTSFLWQTAVHAGCMLVIGEEGKSVCSAKAGLEGIESSKRAAANSFSEAALESLLSSILHLAIHQHLLAMWKQRHGSRCAPGTSSVPWGQ